MNLLRQSTGNALCCAAVMLCAACGTQPRPVILSELDAARQTDTTLEAAKFAPQSYAQAEQHRQAAERDWKDGRLASSQIAAERALAGYDQTQAAARVARTERQLAEAQQRVSESQNALGQLQAQLKQVTAEQTDLDTQIKIEQDAETLAPPKPASPERELARRETARALSAQARLLCAATRLLTTPTETLNHAIAGLDALDGQLKQARVPAPVDVAVRLRAECLHELTLARRPLLATQPQSTTGDELFVKLSSAHLAPSRDDRGIAITFHDAFAANGLAPATVEALRQLGPVIKQHAGIPMLVVVHAGTANASRDQARGKAATDILKQLGTEKTDMHAVGDNLPLLDRHRAGAQPRNERLEVVFVLPST